MFVIQLDRTHPTTKRDTVSAYQINTFEHRAESSACFQKTNKVT